MKLHYQYMVDYALSLKNDPQNQRVYIATLRDDMLYWANSYKQWRGHLSNANRDGDGKRRGDVMRNLNTAARTAQAYIEVIEHLLNQAKQQRLKSSPTI